MTHPFTPRTKDGNRLSLQLDAANRAAFDTLPSHNGRRTVVIRDTTGKEWIARRAQCGADCFCDAVVTPVRPEGYSVWQSQWEDSSRKRGFSWVVTTPSGGNLPDYHGSEYAAWVAARRHARTGNA